MTRHTPEWHIWIAELQATVASCLASYAAECDSDACRLVYLLESRRAWRVAFHHLNRAAEKAPEATKGGES